MRTEIQALRAAAVALVVAYHLWPSAVDGGYIGVDVFFVISGFLITGQLLRAAERDGRVSLADFWARRARRILPAALVVLAFCAVATKLVVPETQWQRFLDEVVASAAYVENWHLANTATDYLASDDAASPVRHFWSLSVEEQFYVVWPLLIMLALAISNTRRSIAAVLGTVTVASFVYGVIATANSPADAFFITPTRAWEFGIGGLLALLPDAAKAAEQAKRRRPPLRTAVSWAGMVAVFVSAFAYSDATQFPGVAAALPVLGTAAVIWAAAPSLAMELRPVQWLGDISYSVYLWHWPLLILAPYALERGLADGHRIAILALTLLLGWLSKVAIEDPIRTSKGLARRPARWSLVPAAAGTLAVLFVASTGAAALDDRVDDALAAAERTADRPPPCFGAAVLDPATGCSPNARKDEVVPEPVAAEEAPNAPCKMLEREGLVLPCVFGVRERESTRSVALIGDSHASHWRAALAPVADARGWRGVSIARSHCGYSSGTPQLDEPDRSGCIQWRSQVRSWLERHPEVTTVVLAQFRGESVRVSKGTNRFEAEVAAYTKAWRALPRSVEQIIVMRDNPWVLNDGGTLDCVERAVDDGKNPGRACALPRKQTLGADAAVEAAKRLDTRPVAVVDMTSWFCPDEMCPAVIGGALVYKDANHITAAYGATLAPYLGRKLDRILGERLTSRPNVAAG